VKSNDSNEWEWRDEPIVLSQQTSPKIENSEKVPEENPWKSSLQTNKTLAPKKKDNSVNDYDDWD
jgi:hypothetical protein